MRFNERKKSCAVILCTLLLMAMPLTAASASGILTPYQPPALVEGAGRKLLAIYMVGSDLEWDTQKNAEQNMENLAASKDLDELIKGYNSLPNKDKIDIVVAFGGTTEEGWWKGMKIANISQLIQDSNGKYPNSISIYGNESAAAYLYKADGANMGDESSLKLFLDYLKDGYRNHDRKFLVFWYHGGSYDGCCNDMNFEGDGLSLTEIDNGLSKNFDLMGMFDLIGFDQCLMGSIEVAKIIKKYSKYMVASEELEPGHGWEWSEVIKGYAGNAGAIDAAKYIADTFVQDIHSYQSDGKTLSVLDMSKFDNTVSKLDAAASALRQNLGSDASLKQGVIDGTTKAQKYGANEKNNTKTSVDLKHFAQIVMKTSTNADTNQKLNDLISAVEGFVVHSKDDGTKPNSFGLSIAPPEVSTGDANTYAASPSWLSFQEAYTNYKNADTTPPTVTDVDQKADSSNLQWDASANETRSGTSRFPEFLQGERAAFVNTESRMIKREVPGAKGLVGTFSDSNLAKVTTIFGFESGDFFVSVAEVKAYPTTTPGRYFTPDWNRKWYCVAYDPSAPMTAWMPMMFIGTYQKDGKTYTIYTAEIDYYAGGTAPPDLATLEIHVDDKNVVTDHSVRTYKVKDGKVHNDRSSYKIKAGDKIQFYSYGFHKTDPAQDEWLPADEIITFTQSPKFTVELLEFEDDKGVLLPYKYSMYGEDINGNGVMTPLIDAALPCINLNDDFALNMCASYKGVKYGFTLNYIPVAADSANFYWKMDVGTFKTVTDGQCISVADDLKVNSCAQYHGESYDFTLNYSPVQSDPTGLYWKLDLGTFKHRE